MMHAHVDDNSAPLGSFFPSNSQGRLARAASVLARRRALVLVLNLATMGVLIAGMGYLLSMGGWTPVTVAMMVAYVITLPWLTIGFWNAVIGACLLRGARAHVGEPSLKLDADAHLPIVTRTAIVMALRNEEPAPSVERLRALHNDLIANGYATHFDIHVLSDTNDGEIAREEEQQIEAWRLTSAAPQRIFYRRRTDNRGYKAGNIEEFCDRTVDHYDYFLPLDADSIMSAAAVTRLVRVMQVHSEIGILQSLVVGTPSRSFFTRVFQFGMRQGMRSYTAGSAWWQGDCGPFWGHNALIRMRAFHDHCRLPVLPGNGPLSGHIMSHDQVEAVLMRRAGYHVRVLVEEGESWEENPPTLPDFIRRELRWCQGNMQYFQLLGMPRLKMMSRVQLALAILMYVGAPGWMAFITLGLIHAAQGGYGGEAAASVGLMLFAFIMTMSLSPKVMGLVGVMSSARQSAAYGGRGRVIVGGLLELIVSALMAPIVAFAIAVFAIGLLFGKRIDWRAQPRGIRRVAWDEASISFWPQMLFGAAITAVLSAYAPAVLPWAMPVILGFLLAIPIAVLSTSRMLGAWSVRTGLCAIPEDTAPPPLLRHVLSRIEDVSAQTEETQAGDVIAREPLASASGASA